MKGLLKQYLPFLNTSDFIFVIEIFGGVLRGSLVEVETKLKRVTVRKTVQLEVPERPIEAFTNTLPKFLKKFRLPAAVRSIVLLDLPRATIMSGVVSLMRSDPKAEIKQAELENLISQGLWKLVNTQRSQAAKKMEIPDMRVRLADADVVQVRLNNHRVVNPIGFTARTVELCYRQTFLDQVLLERLTSTLTEDNLAAIVEAPAVLAGLVARLHPRDEFLFISVGATETAVYHTNQMTSVHVDSFGWGAQTLRTAMAKHFACDLQTAHKVLGQYARHEVSPSMRRAVEAVASGELAMLSNGIAAHQPNGSVLPVYVHAATELPAFLFDPQFARRLGLTLTLTPVNQQFISQHTGFVVQLANSQQSEESSYTFDAAVATIADIYMVSAAPVMSKTAKQRARWIQAAGKERPV